MRIFGCLLAACLIAAPAHARDYGQQGALFPITEPDLLEQIQRKLMALQASGATAKLNEDLKRRTIAKVNRPAPVSGLGIASAIRSWAFDPTISVAEDISDDTGRLIMAAGDDSHERAVGVERWIELPHGAAFVRVTLDSERPGLHVSARLAALADVAPLTARIRRCRARLPCRSGWVPWCWARSV